MKAIVSLIGLSLALATSHAFAKDYVLLDTDKAPQDWRITSQELGLKVEKPFSVSVRNLHGGAKASSGYEKRAVGDSKLTVLRQ